MAHVFCTGVVYTLIILRPVPMCCWRLIRIQFGDPKLNHANRHGWILKFKGWESPLLGATGKSRIFRNAHELLLRYGLLSTFTNKPIGHRVCLEVALADASKNKKLRWSGLVVSRVISALTILKPHLAYS